MEKVEPIRDPTKLAEIKSRLRRRNPRHYAFFVVGINTALRPGDVLRIRAGDVYEPNGKVKPHLYIRSQKTNKPHRILLNEACQEALAFLWEKQGPFKPHERLFPWTRQHAWRLVNRWCREVGLTGRYGGHTLRKTWGYMARKFHGVPIELIQSKLGHRSPTVTQRYIGITDDEIEDTERRVIL